MSNKRIDKEDAMIRQMMRESQMEAPENLRYRIMQQIETEAALTRQPQPAAKRDVNPLRSFWSVFGVMYVVLALIAGVIYFTEGVEVLLSLPTVLSMVLVAGVFSVYWLMLWVEERLREKRKG